MVDLDKHIDKDLIGYFWLPNSEDDKFQGHLKFNEDEILISLNGSFPWQNYEILPNGSKSKSFNVVERFEVICGEVEGLGKVTFFDSIEAGNNMNWVRGSSLFQKQTITTRNFFIGDNFKSKNEIKFDKISFFIKEINSWAHNICGFKYNLNIGKQDLKGINLNYKFPSKKEFKIERINKVLSLESNFSQKGDRKSKNFSFSEDIYLNLKTEKGHLLFEDVINNIYALKFLLNLFINDNLEIRRICLKKFNLETKKFQEYCHYYSTKDYSLKYKKTKPDYKMFVLFPHIENDFQEIVNEWFKFKDNNSHILDELFIALSNNNPPINKFLSYSKILEAFHRNLREEPPFDEEKIKEINREIKDNVLICYDEEIKKRYLEKFSHINTFNLQEGLDFLLDRFLSDDIKKELNIEPKFTEEVKKLRNDLTHLNKKIEDLDFNFLYEANKKLKFVIYIIIFRSIKVSNKILLDRVKDDWIKRGYK